jgi:hypothetical protein
MTYLDMLLHYTCSFNKNRLARVFGKWENYKTVTQWGYSWEGGFLIEDIDGNKYHLHGWRESDAPWMNESWVYVDQIGDSNSHKVPQGHSWQNYPITVNR